MVGSDTHTQLNRLAGELQQELDWFQSVLSYRLQAYFKDGPAEDISLQVPPPRYDKAHSIWSQLVEEEALEWEERLALLLALAPHLRPQALDILFTKNPLYDRPYSEFGGLNSQAHRGFLPNGETLLFLLAGADLTERIRYQHLLHPGHRLYQRRWLQLRAAPADEPVAAGALVLNADLLAKLTQAGSLRPAYSAEFPAQRIETTLDWPDLVLTERVQQQIQDIQAWILHQSTLLHEWGMAGRIRPGLRVLFYGPPGTGKTITASVLGKATGYDVYRIDLSLVVSKYIGETEKNLGRVFQQAEDQQWMLFFDEADALFGKRGETKSAHDRYANQEVAYLLQRIEQFQGVVILATNFKGNLDKAFVRRFEAFIQFTIPGPAERLQLWRQSFPPNVPLSPDIGWEEIARSYELSGGAITNAVRYAALQALQQTEVIVTQKMILAGIREELIKEGKVL